jgi:hypothetical protein
MRTGRKRTDTHAGREDEEISMRRYSIAATIFFIMPICWSWPSATAQSMDDLNLQVHGYATRGFIYTTNNNWDTTNSTDGSSAWTEAVVNVTAQPQPKLRIGVQARYYLLGTYGNAITLDWAEADYKVNEHFGFRVGKVKSPMGVVLRIIWRKYLIGIWRKLRVCRSSASCRQKTEILQCPVFIYFSRISSRTCHCASSRQTLV